MSRQFIECRFRPHDTRSYAYANDGEPVAVGDFVEVETRGGAKAIIEVIALLDSEPPFATKLIISKAEKPEPASEEEKSHGR